MHCVSWVTRNLGPILADTKVLVQNASQHKQRRCLAFILQVHFGLLVVAVAAANSQWRDKWGSVVNSDLPSETYERLGGVSAPSSTIGPF